MKYAFLSLSCVILAHSIVVYLYGFTNPLLVMCLFYSVSTVTSISYLSIKKRLISDFKDYKIHFAKANKMIFVGVLEGFAFLTGLAILGLSGSAIVGVVSTIAIIIYGIVKFDEKLSTAQIIFASVIIIAAILYAFEAETILAKTGYVLTAISGFLGFCFSIQQKILVKYVDGIFILLVRAAIMACLSFLLYLTIPLKPQEAPIDIKLIILLAGIAGISGSIFNHYFKMKAYNSAGLSITTLMRSSYPIWVFLIGIFFLHEDLSDIKLLCALIILPASVGLAWVTVKQKND